MSTIDDDEQITDEQGAGCPYCDQDGCEHQLLTVDLCERCPVGGALYEAFAARQQARLNNANLVLQDDDDGSIEESVFEEGMEELDSFPCDILDEDFSGGFPGSATMYRSWYCSNGSVTARLVEEYRALPAVA